MAWNAEPHLNWILTHGRMKGLQVLVDGLGLRLRDEGMALMRVRLGMRTTHPLTAALSFLWEHGGGPIVQFTAPQGLETRSSYVGSPMEYIGQTRKPFRRSLREPLGPEDHVVLHELQRRGGTDYYGVPLDFVEGAGGILMLVSEDPEGFTEDDIVLIDTLATAIAPIAEAHGNFHLATAIAQSYLGPRTGQRVLDGQITRGDIEQTEAAILFSDIRGWTALNTTQSAEHALDVANRYFEVMSDAIDNNEGEILKFLGDGVLALFPSDGTDAGQVKACRQAISAAHAALGIAKLADLPVPFGTGIHYGALLYGNVGARERIDFTVLGQSVNIASRVEAFCGRLDEPVLISAPVARIAGVATRHVGTEVLKGMDTPMALHAPIGT
ncbi:adenylate/guanylate cyclase domain-containing protein [uncultured Tateyamaria sp.]|uniref:adenylate/guanylate cyclase domain-containing protein n=1 Tax=uncultured Tateyamaria sp. TaxID=455651 RepID=UPI002624654F|nr:adenylate/guanylate cyclase domain-containing protein [uncultured Tateyamaria sp.]